MRHGLILLPWAPAALWKLPENREKEQEETVHLLGGDKMCYTRYLLIVLCDLYRSLHKSRSHTFQLYLFHALLCLVPLPLLLSSPFPGKFPFGLQKPVEVLPFPDCQRVVKSTGLESNRNGFKSCLCHFSE